MMKNLNPTMKKTKENEDDKEDEGEEIKNHL
jgi:hypothetical protein